jgi:Transposase DDE domain
VSAAAWRAFVNNRRRTRGARGQQLQRKRSERVERSFGHVCDTGGARRSWLHGIEKVQKRYLIAAVARNLGLLLRKLFGMGTPRGLQAEGGVDCLVCLTWIHISGFLRRPWTDRPTTDALGVAYAASA